MCLLLETIRCENGVMQNLEFHQNRLDFSQKANFQTFQTINLEEVNVPKELEKGLYKCRIIYATNLEKIEFLPYSLPKIRKLKLVENDKIDYAFKYADRTQIRKIFEKRGDADDVLIIKNGLITDTSYANILFFDKKNWFTPALPLLKGTQRAKLLKEQKISVAEIRPENLLKFSKARLINAMIRFEDELDVEIENIRF